MRIIQDETLTHTPSKFRIAPITHKKEGVIFIIGYFLRSYTKRIDITNIIPEIKVEAKFILYFLS